MFQTTNQHTIYTSLCWSAAGLSVDGLCTSCRSLSPLTKPPIMMVHHPGVGRQALLNAIKNTHISHIWLVVWTPLKNISQLGWLFQIYGKIKNVPNHQPDILSHEILVGWKHVPSYGLHNTDKSPMNEVVPASMSPSTRVRGYNFSGSIWGVPEIGVPLNHPFSMGFSMK